jgi:hypothetical protein
VTDNGLANGTPSGEMNRAPIVPLPVTAEVRVVVAVVRDVGEALERRGHLGDRERQAESRRLRGRGDGREQGGDPGNSGAEEWQTHQKDLPSVDPQSIVSLSAESRYGITRNRTN